MVEDVASAEALSVAPRVRDRLALAVATTVSVVILLAGVTLSAGAVGQPGAMSVTPLGEIGTVGFGLTLLALGVVLRSRRPDHPMGWLFVAFGFVVSLSAFVWATMVVSSMPGGDARLGAAAAWFGAVFVAESWVFLVASIVVRFPSGHPASPFEARLERATGVLVVILGILAAFRPGPLLIYPAFENPLSTPEALHPLLVALSSAALVASLVPGALASLAIVRRYRIARPTERLQLRWFAFGAAIVAVASIAYVVGGVVLADDPRVREATYAGFAFAACSLPIAVFWAITSHRLYDIDRIISRTVAYGALTAILAGLYTASLRLFNALFVALTGHADEAALVLTTLVLATTFTPIKTRLERVAARRFDPASALGTPAPALTAEQEAAVEGIARRVTKDVIRDHVPGATEAARGAIRARRSR